jgi:uncharacterized protein (DUF488 family)
VKLYTMGYLGRTTAALASVLDTMPGALLVDVRLVPFARDQQWPRTALARQFAGRYVHLREFGNRAYKRDNAPVLLDDSLGGVWKLLAATKPLLEGDEQTIVLLCAFRHRQGCHRDEVAAVLVRQIGAEDMGELALATSARTQQLGLW